MSKGKLPENWKDLVSENVRSGLIDVMILAMLSEKEMYTYEIRQELCRRDPSMSSMKDGSFYGPIYRMVERGLIVCRREKVGAKRFRNYYSLMPAGREYLEYAIERFREIYGIAESIITDCVGEIEETGLKLG